MMDKEYPQDWKLVKLSDLGEVNRGRSRHRPRYADHLYGGSYPFIQTGDVKSSGGRITEYHQTYSEAGLAQSRLWPAETMCITIAANIAETGILTFPACFPDSIIGFIADESKCDVYFIEYVFRYLKQGIQHRATGSVQDNINLQTLERLRFPLPPLSEQRAIAHILGTLDDKIELNRRMNATLEGIARATFKSWFVDFDPVRANLALSDAEGRGELDLSLPPDLLALFPDAFVESELGEIPAGWKVVSALEEFDVTLGQSPPGSTYNEEGDGLPFYQGSADFSFRYPDYRVYCTDPKRLAERNDTLLSVRAPVGDVNMALETCCIGRGLWAIRHKSGSRSYTYYATCDLKRYFERFNAEGTVFGSLSKRKFKNIPVLSPPIEIVEVFEKRVASLDDLIENNILESRTLAELRDTLLPKLISGELRVPGAIIRQD